MQIIQEKRDSKGIFTAEGDLSTKGMTILHQLLSDSASAHHSTGKKNLQLNPLRVHEPLAAEIKEAIKSHNENRLYQEKYKMNGLIIKPEWLDRIILYDKDIEVIGRSERRCHLG